MNNLVKITVGEDVVHEDVVEYIVVTKKDQDDGFTVNCQATANTMLNVIDSLVNNLKNSNDNPMITILLAAKLHKMGDELIGSMGIVNKERDQTPDKNLC